MSDTPQHFPEDAAKPDVSRETSQKTGGPPPSEKNKRSSVYVYLVILFGAAFLMLLLAYFVQQRNNATAMDDLRSTHTASRQELLEEIDELEEEKLALNAQIAELETQLNELQRQKEEAETDSFWREKDLQSQLESWHDLWDLEQNFRNNDPEACAQFFRSISTSNYYATPDEASERVEEIYHTLVEDGLLGPDELSIIP